MFLRNDHGLDQAGGTATLPFGRAFVPMAEPGALDKIRDTIARIDWAPDLGSRIGSLDWWRGAATCAALCTATCMLAPGFHRTIIGDTPAALDGASWDEARAQSISPLAWGADTGRHMAANDLVVPLAERPERPRVELTAPLGQGDSVTRMLQRAGVSESDASNAVRLISGAVPLGNIKPGTQFDITLGRRPDKTVARPLEQIAFRAQFDLSLSLARVGNSLTLKRHPIAIDHTPLRIQGLAGRSLYRSARAAGAPAKVVEAYIKALATHLSIGRDVNAGDTFDFAVEQARAATGEVQLGALIFAGLDQGRKKTQLVKWTDGQWYEASGQTQRSGTFGMPVAGHITSSFGLRMHPILHMLRMHKGIDIGAPWGTPVRAAMDGVVSFAGRSAGYGNFIKLSSGGNIATGYGHLSRILVRNGEHVARGQLIGAVGSTGLSTGPHLHWEVWKNGVSVNPRSMSFSSVAQLSGEALRAFKAKFAYLMSVKPGR
ncbi:peptidoglycan DD-metalloendopeptidase family protein [Sphingomonas oligophenolica]|uniref:M23 family metallopeptidase n=1 Tax=Sphingomonas oligophenolica TaxID=301154 RepID=A0ABU9Y2S1_9SPHN